MVDKWIDVVKLIVAAGEGNNGDLENQFFDVWQNRFPRFTIDDHFLQRLNDHHRQLKEPGQPGHDLNQGHYLNRTTVMNCVEVDRTTQTAW